METKPTIKPYESKTVWMNLLAAIAVFLPGVDTFIANHPEQVMLGFTIINLILRALTKDKISLK